MNIQIHRGCQLKQNFEMMEQPRKNTHVCELKMALSRLPKNSTSCVVLEKMQIQTLAQNFDQKNSLLDVLHRFQNMQLLDLSSNQIDLLLPIDIAQKLENDEKRLQKAQLKSIISCNLSDNPIKSIRKTIKQIQILMPNLTDLQISLFKEDDVDFIMKNLPQLEFLNNLPVERVTKDQLSTLEEGSKSTIPMIPDEFDEFGTQESKKHNNEHPQSEVTQHNFEKDSGSNSFQKPNQPFSSTRDHTFVSNFQKIGFTVTQNQKNIQPPQPNSYQQSIISDSRCNSVLDLTHSQNSRMSLQLQPRNNVEDGSAHFEESRQTPSKKIYLSPSKVDREPQVQIEKFDYVDGNCEPSHESVSYIRQNGNGSSDNMITAKSLGNIQSSRQNGSSHILTTKRNPINIVEKELNQTISSIGNGNSDIAPKRKQISLVITPKQEQTRMTDVVQIEHNIDHQHSKDGLLKTPKIAENSLESSSSEQSALSLTN